jgi:threonine/homoserine/homoserine lactone efflux protein
MAGDVVATDAAEMTHALGSLAAFIATASLLVITPGLDTALVLRTAASGGARRAVLAGLGIAAGCFCWAMLVALGLGALLAASQLAYAILRWTGEAYLVWVGIRMIRHPRQQFLANAGSPAVAHTAFTTGALTNLLNPKVGMFYVSLLPQFVPPGVAAGPYILLLGAIHALLGLVWFCCLITATRPICGILRRPGVVLTLDRLTGGVFMVVGVGLALESRRR